MTSTTALAPKKSLPRRGRLLLVAAASALAACGGQDQPIPAAEIPAPRAGAEPIDIAAPAAMPGTAAESPEAAVRTFLDARSRQDAAASLAILADLERANFVTVEDWELRSESLPEVTDYEITGTSGTQVTVEATLTPRLDASAGFRPGRAVMTWETVIEGGGHRVSLAATRLEPVLPDAAAATGVALRWADTAIGCAPEGQYAGNLLGDPLVAEALCGADVSFDAGPTLPLSDFVDPAAIQASLGADAAVFTTVVRLDGPAPLDVVLAPLGEQWQVIAVAPPR